MSTQIEFIKIEDLNNFKDYNGLGSVPYAFEISKYLITNSIYINFLKYFHNLLPDYVFYDARFCINKNLTCFEKNLQRPAAFINPKIAKIFCNYLFNKENNLPLSYESCYDLYKNKRKIEKGYFLPNKNEWYKAAYFNGKTYNQYPIKDNLEPLYVKVNNDKIVNFGVNTCNFSNAYDYKEYHGFTSRVGECGSSSHYGIFDMAGNLFELIENENILLAGGSWHSFRELMNKETPFIDYDEKQNFGMNIGLRIVRL